MDNWTDGTFLGAAPDLSGGFLYGEHGYCESFTSQLPVAHRRELIIWLFGKPKDYLIAMHRPGDEFAFAKLHCGDFGYYRVHTTYPLPIQAPEGVQ